MLFIDGNNLVHALGLEPNMEGRDALCRKLEDHTLVRQQKATVVFDAYRTGNRKPISRKAGNLTVTYTAENETADSYLYKISRKNPGKRNTLVTSDRELGKRVQANSWKTISSDAFAGKLSQKSLKEHAGVPPDFSIENDNSMFAKLDSKSSNKLRQLREQLKLQRKP